MNLLSKLSVLLNLTFTLFFQTVVAQNVGVGTTNPNEKLDVNGNINVTGTIKVNGVDGAANQVLMKNNSGTLSWGDVCEFKNYTIFTFTSSGAVQNWNVPAGVTKIRAELWGGGGKGTNVQGALSSGAGGGSGGYITGYFTVTGGTSVSVTVGSGANATITSAESSRIDVGVQTLIAFGGGNASFNGALNRIDPGFGTGFTVFNTTNYIGLVGENGKASIVRYDQIATSTYGAAIYGGDGGNSPERANTGGKGGYQLINTSTAAFLSNTAGSSGHLPGGGSASDAANNSGGHGLVIVYY